MANLSLTTSVQLCEDISESYSLIDLFAQAGYSAASATALQFFVEQSDGSYVTAPADSFIKADGSGGVLIDLSVLPDFNGLLGGRVVALDSNGNIVTLSINIDVEPVNDAPEGSDGGASIDEGGAYVFAASDFGFSDPVEGDNFVGLIIDSLPAGGQLLLNGVAVAAGDEVPVSAIDTGALVFQADPGFSGDAAFDFRVRDDGGVDPDCGGVDTDLVANTFTVTVLDVNDVPVAVDDAYSTSEGTPVTASLAGNDTPSTDGGNVWMKLTDPANGTVVVNPDGTFTYTPNPGYAGPDSFTYKITDIDGDVSEASATIIIEAVNDVPLAVDDAYTTAEDTPVSASLAGNDTPSTDGGNVWMKLTDPANGTVVVNPDGTFTYTPDANFSGTDSFTYKITDIDGDVSEATATITIEPGNDVPVAVDDAYTTAEDTPVNGDLSGNDTPSPDGGNVWMKLTDPANGTVVVNPDGTFTYTPDAGFSGADSFTYKITDVDGDVSEATATISVAPPPQNASLGDTVWYDDGDGVLEAGEAGVEGVTVTLIGGGADGVIGTADDTTDQTATDANGNYRFDGLTVGTEYQVMFSDLPQGYEFTGQDQGGDDTLDSDADPVTGKSQIVTLADGEYNDTLDAGIVAQPAHIGDRVWEDSNANGVQDAGESGIAGVTVLLKDAFGNVLDTTTTDGDGLYGFDVAPGTYSVAVEAPTGYVLTAKDAGGDDAADSDVDPANGMTDNVTVGAGESNVTLDAGLYREAAIGDKVWLDKDGDGTQDADEAGVAGVTVNLLDADGNVVASQSTNADGNYLFDGLTPGRYSVAFEAPAGYAFTTQDQGDDATDSDADANGFTVATDLESGETDLSWDAGIVELPKEEVCIQYDFNGSSRTDGYDGNIRSYEVDGVKVNVSAFYSTKDFSKFGTAYLGAYAGGLGVTDVSEGSGSGSLHAIDNVGYNNFVLFEFDRAVTVDRAFLGYVVDDSDLQVWIGNFDDPLNNHLSLNSSVLASMDFTELNGTTSTTTRWADFNAGEVSGNVLVIAADTTDTSPEDRFKIEHLEVCHEGDVVPQKAHIGDKVWLDVNGNGVQDAGEAGVAGVTVTLKDGQGNVVATTQTDANGNYGFDVAAGTYSIKVDAPDGFTFTSKDAGGDDGRDSDVDPATGRSASVTVAAGETNNTLDAGLQKIAKNTGAIGDRVWEDKDVDGIQDSGEAGIAGVTVKLLDGNGNVLATTTTDANGGYLFENLAAGSYKVQVVKPNGYYATLGDKGTNDAIDSDIDSSGRTGLISLAEGETDRSVDAGLYRKASIGDKVWEDMDHDGVQDANEPGIGGIRVSLYGWNGASQYKVASTTTDSQGEYSFHGLDAGWYYVAFDKANVYHHSGWGGTYNMSDWYWASKDSGGDDAKDSDVYKRSGDSTYTDWTWLDAGEYDMSWDAGITPIVIDLDGDGVETVSRKDAGGSFDLFGNGREIESGWVAADDALLAVDANGNGTIDDISELFGGRSIGDGFARLASYDSNGDGRVDAADSNFGDLLVWQDADGDHQTDAGELRTLEEAGIASLSTGHVDHPFVDDQGNLHLESGVATLDDGTAVDMTDVYFNVSQGDAARAGVELPSIAELMANGGSLLSDDGSVDALLGTPAGSVADPVVGSRAGEVPNHHDGLPLQQLADLLDSPVYA